MVNARCWDDAYVQKRSKQLLSSVVEFITNRRFFGPKTPLVLDLEHDPELLGALRKAIHQQIPASERAWFPLKIEPFSGTYDRRYTLTIVPPRFR